jgi:AraC family transcriptional regulator
VSIHSRDLYRSDLLTVRDMTCRPETLACGCEECSTRHALVFARRGAFVFHDGSKRTVMDANHVAFFNATHPRRISHLDIGGDDCTALSFSDEAFDETVAAAGIRASDRRHGPFPVRTAPIAPELVLKSQIFFAELAARNSTALKAEERGLNLLAQALRSIPGHRAGDRANPVRRSNRTHGLAVAAQEFVAARPFENWTLSLLASDVGSSPYHLLRVFRAETGSTIHQYRMQLRLSAAVRAILEGCDDLTGLALDLGFSSHSHFTDAFRRRYGMAPSALRGRAGRAQRAQLRKNSTAISNSIR